MKNDEAGIQKWQSFIAIYLIDHINLYLELSISTR